MAEIEIVEELPLSLPEVKEILDTAIMILSKMVGK